MEGGLEAVESRKTAPEMKAAEGVAYMGLVYGLNAGLNADSRPGCVVLNKQLNLWAAVLF